MKTFLIFISIFMAISCGKRASDASISSTDFSFEDYKPYINSVNAIKSSEKSEIKWINKDYPIELKLYSDSRFNWTLDVLGVGEGTWEYANGLLKLNSRTHFFDMDIRLVKIKDSEFLMQFRDRFGYKSIPVVFEK